MPRKPRIHYTETDKALMWDHWRGQPASGKRRSGRVKHSAPAVFLIWMGAILSLSRYRISRSRHQEMLEQLVVR